MEYLPGIGFTINGKQIKWGAERDMIRIILGGKHQEDDRTIDLPAFSEEGENESIIQKRDIYENMG